MAGSRSKSKKGSNFKKWKAPAFDPTFNEGKALQLAHYKSAQTPCDDNQSSDQTAGVASNENDEFPLLDDLRDEFHGGPTRHLSEVVPTHETPQVVVQSTSDSPCTPIREQQEADSDDNTLPASITDDEPDFFPVMPLWDLFLAKTKQNSQQCEEQKKKKRKAVSSEYHSPLQRRLAESNELRSAEEADYFCERARAVSEWNEQLIHEKNTLAQQEYSDTDSDATEPLCEYEECEPPVSPWWEARPDVRMEDTIRPVDTLYKPSRSLIKIAAKNEIAMKKAFEANKAAQVDDDELDSATLASSASDLDLTIAADEDLAGECAETMSVDTHMSDAASDSGDSEVSDDIMDDLITWGKGWSGR